MGGKTTTTQGKTRPDPRIMKQYLALVRKASAAADKPYKEYNGELVADPTADQGRAYAAIRDMQGAYDGYYDNAAAAFDRAGRPITPIAFSGAEVDKYMNPYISRVVDATAANIQRENAIEQQRVLGNAIARGSFGGDRAGFAQAELARSQGLARNQTLAELMSQGYGQALSMFSQQQGVDLNAQQQNNANALAQAQGWMGLGQGRTQTDLAQINAQLQAGQLQQQQRQNELNAKYQQWQNQRAYPFQSIGWLGNIVTGVGNQAGGTQTTTQPNGSLVGGLVGLGTAGLGALSGSLSGSDRRMKTGVARIGRTDDGQPIYKFRYKGDDSGRTHIGLMADQVEKHHPEAVHRGVGGLKFVDYDAATRGVAKRAWGGSVTGSTGSANPYESTVIGADPFGENAIVVRVPGLAGGGGLAPIGMDPYEAGVGYIPKPRPIGLGKFTVDTPRVEAPKGLMGTGVDTKDWVDLGKAAKGAMPKVKGLLGIKTPEDVQKQDDGLLPNASYARGGKAVPPRGVSRAAFSQRSAGDNPGNAWGDNGGYPTPGLSPDGMPGYNNPLAANPNGAIMDGWGVGMPDSGLSPTGHIPGMDTGSYVARGWNTQGLPDAPPSRTLNWNSQIAGRYTGMGGPLGPPVAGRVPAVAHARVTAPDYYGTTSLNGGVMGGYSGPMSDAGYGSVADPNNYGGFAGHGYGTHDYGVGAQMTGFTGADNFGFTDFSGNSPSSNGPSSGGSSGGSGGSAGYGTAGDNEPRARGGRTIAPMPALPPAAPMGFDTGVARMRVRRSAPALHQTRSIGDIGGAGGGWDPAGNPVDPGINAGTTADGRTGSPGNGYADPTFGGTLQDQGGWADVGGWQNAGDYLRNQLPGDPNGFQGLDFTMPADFSKQPIAERGWGGFGPNGLQPGAMGPAPNPSPLGYSYSPTPTSGGSSGGYGGGFSGSADAPGTAAGTGSFGTADGYDSRAYGGKVSGGLGALMFARGGAKVLPPRGGVAAVRAPGATTRSDGNVIDRNMEFNPNGSWNDWSSLGPPPTDQYGNPLDGRPQGSYTPPASPPVSEMRPGMYDTPPPRFDFTHFDQFGRPAKPFPGETPPLDPTKIPGSLTPTPVPPTITTTIGGRKVTVPNPAAAPSVASAGAPMGSGYNGPMSNAGFGEVPDPNNYGGFAGHGYGTHDYGVGAQMTGFTGADNFGFTDFSGNSPSSNGPSSGGSSGGYSGATSGGFGGADGFESRARGGGVARLKFASGGVPMSEYITEEEARAQIDKDEEAAARFVAQGKAEGTVGADGKMPRPAAVLNPEAERRVIPGSRRAIPMVEEPDMAPPSKGVAAIARVAPETGVAVKPVPKSGPAALVEKIRNSVTGEGEGFSPETRAALMAAGFRMMASTNRNPLIAIGEGGGAGVAQYNTGVQQTQGQTRLDLLARQLQQEKQLREQELAQALPVQIAQARWANRAVPGSVDVETGKLLVPTGTESGPQSLPAGAKGPIAGVPGVAGGAPKGAPALPPVPDPAPAPSPLDAVEPKAPPRALSPDEKLPIPEVPAGAKTVGWVDKEGKARADALVADRVNRAVNTNAATELPLAEINAALARLPKEGLQAPGAYSPAVNSFLKQATSIGNMLGLKLGEVEDNVGDKELIRKLALNMANQLSANAEQRSFGALLQSVETVPTDQLTTVGARRVSEAMHAMIERNRDFSEFITKFRSDPRNLGVPLDVAERYFDRYRPPQFYTNGALVRSIPPEESAKAQNLLREAVAKKDEARIAEIKAAFDKRYGRGTGDAALYFMRGGEARH